MYQTVASGLEHGGVGRAYVIVQRLASSLAIALVTV